MQEDQESHPPDRRRHGYKELEEKLDTHAKELEGRLSRFIRAALLAFSIIGLMSAAGLVGFGIILKELGTQADEIQNQRYETNLRNCREQNKHHDDTVDEFNKIADEASKKHPNEADQIEEATKANLRLINSLVPKQDCLRVATSAVKLKK